MRQLICFCVGHARRIVKHPSGYIVICGRCGYRP